jgi:1,4-dihydroxy-2-naphthoate octaprenyltransferase
MNKTQAWLSSLRLRTLPLALSSIGMGSILAMNYRLFQLKIFMLTAATAIFLQILSNLANDYGDAIHGADSPERVGPKRGLQNGLITLPQLRNAIILFVLLALISGCWLLHETTQGYTFVLFLLLGLLCIAAAIKYTAGKKPYGYAGLGDIAVFLFFGMVGVLGTFYLYTHGFRAEVLLPACTMGLLSTGVLNINNMRDINSDSAAGKKTMVVRMGLDAARKYHTFLILFAFAFISIFTAIHYTSRYQFLYLITMPIFFIHIKGIRKEEPANMDKYLKQLSLTTLLLVITFGVGILLQFNV